MAVVHYYALKAMLLAMEGIDNDIVSASDSSSSTEFSDSLDPDPSYSCNHSFLML